MTHRTVRGTTRGATASGTRRRNWRVWLALGALSVGWKLFVFVVGGAVTRSLVSDGIAQLPTPLQAYGLEAKRTALTLWSGPLERHGLVRSVRVMSVHVDDSPAGGGGGTALATVASAAGAPDADRCDGHVAVVRAYTYFAIPYSEARTRCGSGVVEYRVFRRRDSATP